MELTAVPINVGAVRENHILWHNRLACRSNRKYSKSIINTLHSPLLSYGQRWVHLTCLLLPVWEKDVKILFIYFYWSWMVTLLLFHTPSPYLILEMHSWKTRLHGITRLWIPVYLEIHWDTGDYIPGWDFSA